MGLEHEKRWGTSPPGDLPVLNCGVVTHELGPLPQVLQAYQSLYLALVQPTTFGEPQRPRAAMRLGRIQPVW